jgi:hypothetical protein
VDQGNKRILEMNRYRLAEYRYEYRYLVNVSADTDTEYRYLRKQCMVSSMLILAVYFDSQLHGSQAPMEHSVPSSIIMTELRIEAWDRCLACTRG